MAKHGGFETAEITIPKGFFNLGRHAAADAIEDEMSRIQAARGSEQAQTSTRMHAH